jgi:hypothetical protein
LRRVRSSPSIVAGVFAATFLAAVPLALTMRGLIETHLGRSLEAARAADAVNWDWWQEFTAQASGLGAALTPNVIGFAATLDSLSSVLDAQREIRPVAAALTVYLIVWIFLGGGIIDRYARLRPTRAHGFFAACGVFFWRFGRLAVVAGAVYWLLFSVVHGWLFTDLYGPLTRDLSSERVAFAWRALLYIIFGALLVAVNVVVDYAKIRLVVEDRRSALGALLASLGFVARHRGRVAGLYALNALAFLIVIAVWAAVAPGADVLAGAEPFVSRNAWTAFLSAWLGFVGSQIYVLARLVLKLVFIGSQTALFQSSLAHAAYTAAPAAAWPEAPAVELFAPGP